MFENRSFDNLLSQTFTNRSFLHAGTASGYVVNITPPDSFPRHNTAETMFDRLEAHGLTWRVYCNPPAHVSFTALIHAARLKDRFATTSSPPASSSKMPPTATCPPTHSSSAACCTATRTCTRQRTPCSPAWPWICPPPCS
jgi:phospholipase C